jgi:hypothetical protein
LKVSAREAVALAPLASTQDTASVAFRDLARLSFDL